MFSINNVGKSIDYIESHLTDDLCITEIADVAHYSPFHFQRLFQILTGTTIGDYIRNRRMTLASNELIASRIKILDLALKYQYESPEAFSRAFKKLFGVTPTQVRNETLNVKKYPKLSVQLKITAEQPLNYRILEKDAFYIEGFETHFTAKEIVEGIAYNKFWKANNKAITSLMLKNNSTARIGAGAYRQADHNIYDAIIGCFSNQPTEYKVNASKWCVFYGQGPLSKTLHPLWSRIFLEWFPETSYQHSGLTEIEVFPNGDTESPEYQYEVWIPLRSVLHESHE